MHGQIIIPGTTECIGASIVPDIGPVQPMLAQLEGVDVGTIPDLEHEDQLMAGGGEGGPHAIFFYPDGQGLLLVIEIQIGRTSGGGRV